MPDSSSDAGIPVIDLNGPDAAPSLLQAAETYGFVYVKHNELEISHEDVARMFALSKEFFAAPTEVKAQCTINTAASGKNHGWLPMHGETLDPQKQKTGDFKEAFNLGEFVHGKAQQPLPEPLKTHHTDLKDFFDKCHGLCNRMLGLFAEALEIDSAAGGTDWFAARHDHTKGPSGRILRLLHYPVLPASRLSDPDEDIRAGAHSDYGSVTLLFRLPDQPGLEVLTPGGQWASVPTRPEGIAESEHLPILVNIGDLLSYWTNGLLKSTVHRVIFPIETEGPPGDRYSIAYFCHPLDDAELSAIPSEKVTAQRRKLNGHAPVMEVMTARDHLNSRLAATYKIA